MLGLVLKIIECIVVCVCVQTSSREFKTKGTEIDGDIERERELKRGRWREKQTDRLFHS